VESRITLFSCRADLNWHKLIMVRSLVVSCDPYLPRLDRIVDLRRGGKIMSNLQVRNKKVDGMQLSQRGYWFPLFCFGGSAQWH